MFRIKITPEPRLPAGYIDHNTDGELIYQRVKDGYINATAMCRANNRKMNDYTRLDTTKPFIQELTAVTGIPATELIQRIKGGTPHLQGTWVHPQVAIHLAQWLSPKFAVLITKLVMDWMSGKAPANSTTYMPYHLRRFFENKHNVPYGYFSMLSEAYITLIGPLERLDIS